MVCDLASITNNLMSTENNVNLVKQSLPQLQELAERQHKLLQNKKLLEKLKDRGESVKLLHDKIEKEIKYRKDLESVEVSVSALSISEKNAEFLKEKHIEYLCKKEKPIEDTRYRPHRTLIHKHLEISVQKSPKKENQEITSAFEPKLRHDGTVCIPLSESLVIESDQTLKLIEEKAKILLHSVAVIESDNSDNSREEEETNDNEEA